MLVFYCVHSGLTPLALAAAAGHVEVCEVLLAHKADIEAQTEKNKDTALSLACASGRLEVSLVSYYS